MTQAPEFEFRRGTDDGLELDEITNVFIPDLPEGLSDGTAFTINHFLVLTAAAAFLRKSPSERGLIVAGKSILRPKTPAQPSKTAWHDLINQGVPAESIDATATGVDPVTNFVRAQARFDHRSTNAPVGIVTPHGLWAIHKHIGERTMVRAYGGLLIPGLSGEQQMVNRADGLLSHWVARGQNPHYPEPERAEKRARVARRVAGAAGLSGSRFYGRHT